MSAEATQGEMESDTDDEYTPEYGDTFRHTITGDEFTVHDVRDGRVTWVSGGWDSIEDLRRAVSDAPALYEAVSVGDAAWEGDGYGDY